MTMPGFTAESSLGNVNPYRVAPTLRTSQRTILPAQLGGLGEIPVPDGPDVPKFPGLPDFPGIPHVPGRRLCFYPCRRICLPSIPNGRRFCFYPCRQICRWI